MGFEIARLIAEIIDCCRLYKNYGTRLTWHNAVKFSWATLKISLLIAAAVTNPIPFFFAIALMSIAGSALTALRYGLELFVLNKKHEGTPANEEFTRRREQLLRGVYLNLSVVALSALPLITLGFLLTGNYHLFMTILMGVFGLISLIVLGALTFVTTYNKKSDAFILESSPLHLELAPEVSELKLVDNRNLGPNDAKELKTFIDKIQAVVADNKQRKSWVHAYLKELIEENKEKPWWTLGAGFMDADKRTAISRWIRTVEAGIAENPLQISLASLKAKLGENTQERTFVENLEKTLQETLELDRDDSHNAGALINNQGQRPRYQTQEDQISQLVIPQNPTIPEGYPKNVLELARQDVLKELAELAQQKARTLAQNAVAKLK